MMRLAEFPCSLCGGVRLRTCYPDTRANSRKDSSAFRCTHAGYGSHFEIVQCSDCSFVFCSPRPLAEDVAELYGDVEDPVYVQELEGRAVTFERRAERVAGYRPPPGRLLDVGAYTGSFVSAARTRGFEAEGLEPSTWAVSVAQQSGLPVREGGLTKGRFPGGTFDVITLWDVIEHLADPLDALRDASAFLKPGGLIVVHTMDIESLAARLLGPRWPWLMEMHLHYFSRRTLAGMLEAAGFKVLRVVPEGRHVSLEYLATRVEALLGAWAGKPLGWTARVSGLNRAQLPINMGDLITAYATKP